MKAMTITADSLLPRPKLNCDRGYDTAVKPLSVVMYASIIAMIQWKFEIVRVGK